MSEKNHLKEIKELLEAHRLDMKHSRDETNEIMKETIKLTVNGKIDKLNEKVDNYIAQDNKWKEDLLGRAEPAIIAFEKGTVASNLVIAFAKTISVIGGALLVGFGILEGIKKIFY